MVSECRKRGPHLPKWGPQTTSLISLTLLVKAATWRRKHIRNKIADSAMNDHSWEESSSSAQVSLAGDTTASNWKHQVHDSQPSVHCSVQRLAFGKRVPEEPTLRTTPLGKLSLFKVCIVHGLKQVEKYRAGIANSLTLSFNQHLLLLPSPSVRCWDKNVRNTLTTSRRSWWSLIASGEQKYPGFSELANFTDSGERR